MTQTTWAPSRVMKLPVRPRTPRPVADDGSLTTHRWWRIGWQEDDDGASVFGLVGGRSSVVWRGSVAVVPCALTEGESGVCPCGLHAAADATEAARALGSIVVGGRVRRLETAIAADGADIVVASIEGPLRVMAWCGGLQNGFTVERCERPPRWVVRDAGLAVVLCTRHLVRTPGRLRFDAVSFSRFLRRIVGELERYGVEVSTGEVEPEQPHSVGLPACDLAPL